MTSVSQQRRVFVGDISTQHANRRIIEHRTRQLNAAAQDHRNKDSPALLTPEMCHSGLLTYLLLANRSLT